MTFAGLFLLATTATTHAVTPPAKFVPPPPNTIEVSLFLGPNYVLGDPLPNAIADQRVGLGGSLRVLLRTRYFLDPFIDAGYSFLSKGAARVPAGEPGGPGFVSNRLDAFHVTAGLALDLWRLRFSAGAGVYFFGLATSFAGVDSTTSDIQIGSILGVSAILFRAPRFHLATEFSARNAPCGGLNYFSLGLSVHGDVFRW